MYTMQTPPEPRCWSRIPRQCLGACLLLPVLVQAQVALQRSEHSVRHVSTAPALAGEPVDLYVREVSPVAAGERLPVLFIHGAGTPAEVAFDVPLAGQGWMAYLAERGFATYAMDMTGYGRSTRPAAMADRCNLGQEAQRQEFGTACPPTHATALTTMASDWDDIDAVVEFLKQRHGVEQVNLVAWSQGGPRSAGYAFQHPAKVNAVVVLAPAYNRRAAASATEAVLAGDAITKQSNEDFVKQWQGQAPCQRQYDPTVSAVVWREMLASDPVGASWGSGVRRAPRVPTFGWTPAEVAATTTPMLLVAGLTDGQVNPERVRELYADLGSSSKVLVEMPCASHNAMWEPDAAQLFDASYQWLHSQTFRGSPRGEFTLDSSLDAP